MSSLRTFLTLVTLAALACAPAAAPTSPPPSPTPVPEKVTLVLDWFPNTNHSGLYIAREKGWFAEAGVEVEIQQPSDPSASIKLVGAGQAELGISYQPAVEIARAQDVPVVSVAALLQHNTAAYAAKEGRRVSRPKDFEGKRFGTSGLAQIEPTLRTVMQCDGATIQRVEMINVGQRLSPSLLADQVDVVSMLPAWEGIDLELKGNRLVFIPQREWCVPDLYTIVFISSEQTIAGRPEALRRFVAATSRGYEYAVSNPTEAADILLRAAPDLDKELVRRSQAVLSTQYRADAPKWGIQTAEKWQKHADWMLENKLIAKAIDVNRAFTNAFLP